MAERTTLQISFSRSKASMLEDYDKLARSKKQQAAKRALTAEEEKLESEVKKKRAEAAKRREDYENLKAGRHGQQPKQGLRTIRIDEEYGVVRGRVRKPKAYYFLPRSNISDTFKGGMIDLRPDFSRSVVRSVNKVDRK